MMRIKKLLLAAVLVLGLMGTVSAQEVCVECGMPVENLERHGCEYSGMVPEAER